MTRAEDAADPADGAFRSHAVRDGPAGRAALEIAAGGSRVMPLGLTAGRRCALAHAALLAAANRLTSLF